MTNAPLPPTDRTAQGRSTVVISGASGLIGSALTQSLERDGVRVLRLVRRPARHDNEIAWHPERGEIEEGKLDGVNAAVHLAGENLAQRWTDDVKRRIRESRVQSTTLLATTLAALPRTPRVLLSGSAIGIYGDRGDEILDESSATGTGFLAEVCKAWEAAAKPAEDAGVRVVHLRTGLVLARDGGVLAKMLTPFKLGVGGPLGDGGQWMSWIAIDDMVRALRFLIDQQAMSGPVNLVAPEPVTNRDFSHTLAHVLGRPSFFTVPRVALGLAFGEMADEALLASQRVAPARLLRAGFAFGSSNLETALQSVLS